jgi:imidazolonepropionase
VDRINGLSYEEIANRGGGILNSAKSWMNQVKKKSTTNLKYVLKKRLGTGAVEIKSGYGLTLEGELKLFVCYQAFVSKLSCSYQSYFLNMHSL